MGREGSQADRCVDCPIWKLTWMVTNLFVVLHGSDRELTDGMVEVTPLLLYQHPSILEYIGDKKLRARVFNELQTTFSGRGEEEEAVSQDDGGHVPVTRA